MISDDLSPRQRPRQYATAKLPEGARPYALRVLLDEEGAGKHRKFDCRLYDGCLEYAAALAWMSFSCVKCPLAVEGGSQ